MLRYTTVHAKHVHSTYTLCTVYRVRRTLNAKKVYHFAAGRRLLCAPRSASRAKLCQRQLEMHFKCSSRERCVHTYERNHDVMRGARCGCSPFCIHADFADTPFGGASPVTSPPTNVPTPLKSQHERPPAACRAPPTTKPDPHATMELSTLLPVVVLSARYRVATWRNLA